MSLGLHHLTLLPPLPLRLLLRLLIWGLWRAAPRAPESPVLTHQPLLVHHRLQHQSQGIKGWSGPERPGAASLLELPRGPSV